MELTRLAQLETRLLAQLARDGRLQRLAQIDEAAWQCPARGRVATANQEHAAGRIDHDAVDGDQRKGDRDLRTAARAGQVPHDASECGAGPAISSGVRMSSITKSDSS